MLVWSNVAATLHFHFREHWRELRHGRPGHRFRDRYEQARREEQKCGRAQRILLFIVAGFALLVGLFFALVPGPAIPFFLIAGGLLASESRIIARVMDWIEVQLIHLFAWAKRRWCRLPIVGRGLVLLLIACSSAAFAYLSYRLILG